MTSLENCFVLNYRYSDDCFNKTGDAHTNIIKIDDAMPTYQIFVSAAYKKIVAVDA
jgi:hypothetical protein